MQSVEKMSTTGTCPKGTIGPLTDSQDDHMNGMCLGGKTQNGVMTPKNYNLATNTIKCDTIKGKKGIPVLNYADNDPTVINGYMCLYQPS